MLDSACGTLVAHVEHYIVVHLFFSADLFSLPCAFPLCGSVALTSVLKVSDVWNVPAACVLPRIIPIVSSMRLERLELDSYVTVDCTSVYASWLEA
jgi:hypothetical protein